MSSTYISNYCPAPKEDIDKFWAILRDYTITADEYPDIYNFLPLLSHIRYCDCSDSPTDWYAVKDGHVTNHWLIFVSCRPQDMDRLKYVARRMGLDIRVFEEENAPDMYLPFV